MNQIIVHTSQPITLVGGGNVSEADLKTALDIAPVCVAADGGAAPVLAAGQMPEAVIGDFDSLSDEVGAQVPADRLHHVAEQDSTDFAKCLMRLRTPLVVGVGFLGKRLDHQLAALNTLVTFAEQACVLIGAEELVFHVPPQIRLDTTAGDVVSLFPLAEVSGRSAGLTWPIDGIGFAPGGRVGTSNRAEGPVDLTMDGPGMLAMVPRRLIRQVCQALATESCGRWPARAG